MSLNSNATGKSERRPFLGETVKFNGTLQTFKDFTSKVKNALAIYNPSCLHAFLVKTATSKESFIRASVNNNSDIIKPEDEKVKNASVVWDRWNQLKFEELYDDAFQEEKDRKTGQDVVQTVAYFLNTVTTERIPANLSTQITNALTGKVAEFDGFARWNELQHLMLGKDSNEVVNILQRYLSTQPKTYDSTGLNEYISTFENYKVALSSHEVFHKDRHEAIHKFRFIQGLRDNGPEKWKTTWQSFADITNQDPSLSYTNMLKRALTHYNNYRSEDDNKQTIEINKVKERQNRRNPRNSRQECWGCGEKNCGRRPGETCPKPCYYCGDVSHTVAHCKLIPQNQLPNVPRNKRTPILVAHLKKHGYKYTKTKETTGDNEQNNTIGRTYYQPSTYYVARSTARHKRKLESTDRNDKRPRNNNDTRHRYEPRTRERRENQRTRKETHYQNDNCLSNNSGTRHRYEPHTRERRETSRKIGRAHV